MTFDPLKLFGLAKFLYGQVITLDTCPNGQVGKKVYVEPWLYSQFVWSMPKSRENFQRNNIFSLYDLYGHTIVQEPLPQGWGQEIYNFGRPFLSHHIYAISLSESCPRVYKKIIKQIHVMQFHYMTYKTMP